MNYRANTLHDKTYEELCEISNQVKYIRRFTKDIDALLSEQYGVTYKDLDTMLCHPELLHFRYINDYMPKVVFGDSEDGIQKWTQIKFNRHYSSEDMIEFLEINSLPMLSWHNAAYTNFPGRLCDIDVNIDIYKRLYEAVYTYNK